MPTCAYCDREAVMTREHIWPDWLLKRTDYDRAFSARAGKIVSKDLTIRDVCGPCNYGPLSALDGYAKTLYDRYIEHWVVEDQTVDFEYDHSKLMRWLLKVSFNSARMSNTDGGILAKYRSVLIEPAPVSPIFAVAFVGTIMPAHVIDPGQTAFRRINPTGARCGPILIPGYFGLQNVLTRCILINSYIFTLLVIDDPWLNANAGALSGLVDGIYGTPLQPDGFTRIPPPGINALQAFQGVQGWPA